MLSNLSEALVRVLLIPRQRPLPGRWRAMRIEMGANPDQHRNE